MSNKSNNNEDIDSGSSMDVEKVSIDAKLAILINFIIYVYAYNCIFLL